MAITRVVAGQTNGAHRDTDVGMFMTMDVRLLRSRKRLSGYSAGFDSFRLSEFDILIPPWMRTYPESG